jgi:hypothetical protein
MTSQPADRDRLEAQMRAADARLDQMEAAARARNAQGEMNEISGLRARRDKVRQQLAAARKEMQNKAEEMRQHADADWSSVRRDIANAHSRFSTWDNARERRFNAHLDEAAGALRESQAKDAETAANVRAQLADARQELQNKVAEARRHYEAWREQRTDQGRQRALDTAELELEEASNRFAATRENAEQPGQRASAD